jgi:hypothetical protein
MALSVNEELSTIGDVQGTVMVDSDSPGPLAYTELESPECRRKALMFAASKGLASPGINGNVETFPIGEDGKEIDAEDIEALKKTKVAGFRAAVPVTRKIA